MEQRILTTVLHHPARTRKCLTNTLDSLNHASMLQHHVEVIIQGPLRQWIRPPNPRQFPKLHLTYVQLQENVGVAPACQITLSRFEKERFDFWAKIDDDITFEEGAFDALMRCFEREQVSNQHNVGYAMLAPPGMRPFLWWANKDSNGAPSLVKAVGHHAHRRIPEGPEWFVCDVTEVGCTIFKRELIMKCRPDPHYRYGMDNFDLMWQATKAGFKSVLCTDPGCYSSGAGECDTPDYINECRPAFPPDLYREYFRQKWGVDIPEINRACPASLVRKFKATPKHIR